MKRDVFRNRSNSVLADHENMDVNKVFDCLYTAYKKGELTEHGKLCFFSWYVFEYELDHDVLRDILYSENTEIAAVILAYDCIYGENFEKGKLIKFVSRFSSSVSLFMLSEIYFNLGDVSTAKVYLEKSMKKKCFPNNIYNYAKYFGGCNEVLDAILFLNKSVVVSDGEINKDFENNFECFNKHCITMSEMSPRNFDSMIESLNKRLFELRKN
ncbi:hypothetical protein [Motilimonas eburnea]|uniref:hypothetical protein n=1 Tax=Motilimonas eburnea TaxID=1737488 RepID=UPI001E620D41|nr:hypothetical protein [Motilimonas eburnea]MCE2570718.1 hypothetical protein [Motilimonas eburnea]